MIEDVKQKEREPYETVFHAKEVPEIVKIPLWSKMKLEAKNRREKVHQNALEIMRKCEKPFSF